MSSHEFIPLVEWNNDFRLHTDNSIYIQLDGLENLELALNTCTLNTTHVLLTYVKTPIIQHLMTYSNNYVDTQFSVDWVLHSADVLKFILEINQRKLFSRHVVDEKCGITKYL